MKRYTFWDRIMMVFSPKRLQQAIGDGIAESNKSWRNILSGIYTDAPITPNTAPFISRHVVDLDGVWCNGRKWGHDTVVFKHRSDGAVTDFSLGLMQGFWDEAAKALGSYILENGYGQMLLTEDPNDKGSKIVSVCLNVYNRKN